MSRGCARRGHGVIVAHFANMTPNFWFLAAFGNHSWPPLFELWQIPEQVMTLKVCILTPNFFVSGCFRGHPRPLILKPSANHDYERTENVMTDVLFKPTTVNHVHSNCMWYVTAKDTLHLCLIHKYFKPINNQYLKSRVGILARLCIIDPSFFPWTHKFQLKLTITHPLGCACIHNLKVKYPKENHWQCQFFFYQIIKI